MGVVERSREVMAVMALHEALRNVCTDSDWTYSVFWTIRPRPRLRGGLGCKSGDEGSLMLMWEDGFCRPAAAAGSDGSTSAAGVASTSDGIRRIHSSSSLNLGDDVEEDDPVRKAFRKMSIQLYNYGEGLMGKVASDKCHKWVFRESSETEVGPLNYWQSSFDSHPPEWSDQFSAGIQTIAVIQAGHGLLQLGSCKIVAEDLHFVLRMRYTFESLESHAGGFMSQTFAPMRNRFFCGTGTPATASTAPPSVPWTNSGQAGNTGFFQNSDFRLRLGNDPVAAQDFLRATTNEDNNSITSLRLSLQNAVSDRALGFEFRNSEHTEEGNGSGNNFSSGLKRPAGPQLVSGQDSAEGRANLLSRRMQFNKMNHHLADNSTTLQQLLEGNQNVGFSTTPPAVFLPNNGAPAGEHTSSLHEGLMVQIPPVIASSTSPMISPMSASKIQRTGDMSPMIQAALQEAMERSQQQQHQHQQQQQQQQQQQPRSGNSSPLHIRLAKQPQFNGANSSHPGTPTAGSSAPSPAPSHSPYPGSRPTTPNHTTPDHHFITPTSSHPGTPKVSPPSTEMHFLNPANDSHSGTPSRHSTPRHPDNFLNNTNTNGCLPDHTSSLILDSNYVASANKQERSSHLQMPAAPWDNLKEPLDMPHNTTDFVMDGFFE